MRIINQQERSHFMVCIFLLGCCYLPHYSILLDLMEYWIFITDLQLDVKGCKDVYASFDKYVEVERLEGDNKYHAEHHGLQVKPESLFFFFFFLPFIIRLNFTKCIVLSKNISLIFLYFVNCICLVVTVSLEWLLKLLLSFLCSLSGWLFSWIVIMISLSGC